MIAGSKRVCLSLETLEERTCPAAFNFGYTHLDLPADHVLYAVDAFGVLLHTVTPWDRNVVTMGPKQEIPVDPAHVSEELMRAWTTWVDEGQLDLHVIEVQPGDPRLQDGHPQVWFISGAIDGPGNIGAETYLDPATNNWTVQFDNAESWVTDPADVMAQGPAHVYQVSLHEIGNVLGLAETQAYGNVTAVNQALEPPHLSQQDKEDIQALYPLGNGSVQTLTLSPDPADAIPRDPNQRPAAPAIGVFDPATAVWYVRSSASAGAPDLGQFAYGEAGWLPVTGDWQGNGEVGIGVVDPRTMTWYLRNEVSPGAPDAGTFQFGEAGWIPTVLTQGGKSHIGVYDPHTGLLYQTQDGGVVTEQYAPGQTPVAGAWDGATNEWGTYQNYGLFNPGTAQWSLPTGSPRYGGAEWFPVAGRWDGSWTTSYGVVDPATETWHLREHNSDVVFRYGAAGWLPLVFDTVTLQTLPPYYP